MAEIETVLVPENGCLQTPMNARNHGVKFTDASTSVSTTAETPFADTPSSLRLIAVNDSAFSSKTQTSRRSRNEGKGSKDERKDLDTPPRFNSAGRGFLMNRMSEQFPSPEVPHGILSPSISEVTESPAVKNRRKNPFSPDSSRDTVSISTSRVSIKPNHLFRDNEAKKSRIFSSVRRAPAPETPEAERQEKNAPLYPRRLPDTPESQPGRIVPHTNLRDDASWCASSVCPFDCVDEYQGTSVDRIPYENEEKPKETKKGKLFSFLKKTSVSNEATAIESSGEIPRSVDTIGKPKRGNKPKDTETGDIKAPAASDCVGEYQGASVDQLPSENEEKSKETKMGKLFSFFKKTSVSNEVPAIKSSAEIPRSIDTTDKPERGDKPEDTEAGRTKAPSELDETVCPSKSYEFDENTGPTVGGTARNKYCGPRPCGKQLLFQVLVPTLLLSIIVLAGVLAKQMRDKESNSRQSVTTTVQTSPPSEFNNESGGDFDKYFGQEQADTCSDATLLQPSNVGIVGNTHGERFHDVPSCGFVGLRHSAPGRWFAVSGTGSGLEASTCSSGTDLDTEISIFSGSCDALECIAGTGESLPCDEGGSVVWESEPGEDYFIYVSGRGSRVGEFWLTLTEIDLKGTRCSTAQFFEFSDSLEISGSTKSGSHEIFKVGGEVGSARGFWYELVGTGHRLQVSTCKSEQDYDSRVSVFDGDCGAHGTVGQSSKCGEEGDSVKWNSTAGSRYHLFVHGAHEDETGDFVLTVEQDDGLNDSCEIAIPIETAPSTYLGSTLHAALSSEIDVGNAITSEPTSAPISDAKPDKKGNKGGKDRRAQDVSDSCNYIPPSRGLWYQIIGNGGEIILSTCSVETDFDTTIDVFSGGCGELQCIASNNDSCGSQSLVRFVSEIDVEYFIHVRGVNPTQFGQFSLGVTVRSRIPQL
eukprot:scaffold499_cov120-Cylindrotheca_fusiformis.AAC.5